MPQLTPAALRKQIASGETAPLYMLVGEDDVEKTKRVMQAMLKMVKLDIKVLKQAYEQG